MPLKRRVPKRGFHNPFRVEYAVVNLDTLAERFDAGTVVTLDLLRERRLVPTSAQRVKVLAPRRDLEGAHGARAQVQRRGRRRRLRLPAARRKRSRVEKQ